MSGPSLKERFASSAINSAKTAAHDFTKDGGTKSTDDDFGGTECSFKHSFKPLKAGDASGRVVDAYNSDAYAVNELTDRY